MSLGVFTAIFFALTLSYTSQVAFPVVERTTLEALVTGSDFVVVAHVKRLSHRFGVKVAVGEPIEVIKGRMEGEFRYLAEPTWMCDISGAAAGEKVLLFLNKPRRTSFLESVARLIGAQETLEIAWSGRGRMQYHTVGAKEYVVVWTGDVKLPDDIRLLETSQRRAFVRSAVAEDIINAIRKTTNRK